MPTIESTMASITTIADTYKTQFNEQIEWEKRKYPLSERDKIYVEHINYIYDMLHRMQLSRC